MAQSDTKPMTRLEKAVHDFKEKKVRSKKQSAESAKVNAQKAKAKKAERNPSLFDLTKYTSQGQDGLMFPANYPNK